MKKFLLIVVFFALAFVGNAQNLSEATVLQMVAQNAAALGLQKDQAGNFKVSSAYQYDGTQYVYLIQTFKGVPIYNQMLVLAFKDNKLLSRAGTLLTNLEKNAQSPAPAITAASAIGAAFSDAKVATPSVAAAVSSKDNGKSLNFGKLAGVSEDVHVDLMWYPNEKDQSLKLVWQVQVVPNGKSDIWLTQIDAANSSVVNKINLTVYEGAESPYTGAGMLGAVITNYKQFGFNPPPPTVTSAGYNVIPYPYESPNHHAYGLTASPWLGTGASAPNAFTNGWHFDGTTNYDITRSNNVHAYLDVDANNTPNQSGNNFSAQSTTVNPALTFNFTPAPTADPNTTANKNVAVTNLFYWNNIIHDIYYQYGFDEVSGNFQTDNLGRGGAGNDYVQAEAEDGGGTNNANFGTPVDGGRPRMQMYLWDAVSNVTLKVNTPSVIAGNYTAIESGFSTANKLATLGPITAGVVYFNDATGGTHDACTGPPSNSLTGKIALINRNTCGFIVKVKEAQLAGAVGVIMVNNVAGLPIVMGGTDNTITIPAVMISNTDGALFAANIATLNVTLSATGGVRMDGDLDNGIITHEYGHGISNRFTGGPANSSCLSNAEEGGEGWSDYSALMLTTNWATAALTDGTKARTMGSYVFGIAGIRRYPYTTDMAINPWTYSGVQTSGGEVHDIGEIWCATLWDMTWAIIQQEGAINPNLYNYTAAGTGGNSIAMKLVTEGMRLQVCSPGFLDARNAIIQADQNLFGGRHFCTIWAAFARRGMGYSAVQGSSNSTADQIQAFDMPPVGAFTAQPQSTTVCLTNPVTFSVTTTGTVTIKWQVLVGTTWTDIPGQTTNSYTFTPTAADNGKQYRAVITGVCGALNSNVATLTTTTAAVGGTLSPATTNNVCVGASGNSTTLTLSGQVGNIIRWEQSIDGGTTWTPIANTNTTLTLTNLTVSTQYRVVVQATGCAATLSTVATINVVAGIPALTVSANQGTTLCAGDPTLLTVGGLQTFPFTAGVPITINTVGTATPYPANLTVSGLPTTGISVSSVTINGFTHTYPVDVDVVLQSPTGQNVILMSDVNGTSPIATPGNTYTFKDGSPAMLTGLNPSGTYRCTNLVGSLGVEPDNWPTPGPLNTPTSTTLSTFNGNVNGVWKLFVVDDFSGDGGAITDFSITFAGVAPLTGSGLTFAWTPAAGLNNTTTNPVAASPAVSTVYTVTVTNAAGCTGSTTIPITVNQRPAIVTQPVAITTCATGTVNFTVGATGTGLTYQWQVSPGNCGGTYTNIAGATSATLTLSPTSAMNGNGYRVIVSGICPVPVTSNCVRLTVNDLPVVVVTPAATCGGVAGINGVLLSTGSFAPPIPGSVSGTNSTPVSVPDESATGATSAITISGVPANASVTKITVTLNMPHTYPGDMIINLKGPNLAAITNLYKYGTNADTGPVSGLPTWGWYGAQIADAGTVNFSSVNAAPYIYGSSVVFKPDGLLNLANRTIQGPAAFTATATTLSALYPASPNGVWTLAMADGGPGDLGTLNSWTIKIDYTTPGGSGSALTYQWTPAAGLYTDANATIPYIAGSQTPQVYAAPTVFTTYTATGTNALTGCVGTGTSLVNVTPPAPSVTPNPLAVCSTDGPTKLKSSSSTEFKKTFTSGTINLAIPDNGVNTGVSNSITVSGIPANAQITKMEVKLNATHTYVGDLIFSLKNPNGTISLDYALAATGGAGATTGFTNTVISSAAGLPALSSGSNPYTGTFAADKAPANFNPSPSIASQPITTTNFNDMFNIAGANGQYTLGVWDYFPGDVGTLQNWSIDITYIVGVLAQPAVWSPATNLYSDASGTTPYIAGTKVDSVWFKPGTTTTYDVTVNSFAAPTGPSQPVTSSSLPLNVTGATLGVYNFKNNNTYPVVITSIGGTFFFTNFGLTETTNAYYKRGAISGPPGAISAANGWVVAGSNAVLDNAGVQPFATGLAIPVAAGETIGIAVEAFDAFGWNLGISTAPALTTFTSGGCSIITGPNIGYAGTDPAPAAPIFSPYAVVGTVNFAPASECTSPVRKVTVTVNTPIAFTKQPVNAAVCTDKVTTFSVTVTGTNPTHNWQVSTANGTPGSWVNITNGGVYSGANTATLTITAPPVSMNSYTYRDSVSAGGVCGPGYSAYANLQVNPLPTAVISAAPYTRLLPGLKTVLSSTVSPIAAANGYVWLKDGAVVPGANASTYTIGVDGIGNYALRVTDINGCTNTSNTITVSDSASGRVFIYPNPNDGRFQVRYNSALGNVNLPRGINVYDARGKRVLTQNYSISAPFARMDVDLRPYGSGVYWIELVDMAGNRLAVGRAEVLR